MKVLFTVILAGFVGLPVYSAVEDGDQRILQTSNYLETVGYTTLNADSLYWQVLTNMPEGRCGIFTGYYRSSDGETLQIHVFGGNAAPCTPHYIFDLLSNSWSTGTALPVEMRYGTSTTYQNKIYMFGSYLGLGTCVIYDILADTYHIGPTMLTPLNDANVALVEDKGLIYLIGGGSGWTASSTVQVYDIAGDSYFYATSLPVGNMCGASGYLGNDTLMLATGYSASAQWSAAVYKGYIDPANPSVITWTADGNIPGLGRRRCGYASFGDKLYIIAGQDGSYNYLSSCYMYKSDSGWSAIPDKPTLCMNHTCLIAPVMLVEDDEMNLFSCAGMDAVGYRPYCEMLHTDVILSVEEEPVIPEQNGFLFSLISGNFSREDVRIKFTVTENSDVRFSIYDMAGRQLRTVNFSGVLPGSHVLTWEKTDGSGQEVPAGTYIFKLTAGEYSGSGKITVTE